MLPEFYIDCIRDKLAGELAGAQAPQQPSPLNADIYVSMSALQKAIRRGLTDLALRSAARLLSDAPEALWRRLGVIAFEDIGLGDPDLLARVVSVLGNKRWRRDQGGEWHVASHLIERMCGAVKDRSADDLVVILQFDPRFTRIREEAADLPLEYRLGASVDEGSSLESRALAAWLAVGTKRVRTKEIAEVAGDREAFFERLANAGYPPHVVELSRTGLTKINEVLAIVYPYLAEAAEGQTTTVSEDPPHEVRMIGDIPSYVFDMHTRGGLAAYREYLRWSQRMTSLLRDHAEPGYAWHRIVGYLDFSVESGVVDRRLRWATGDAIRAHANTMGMALPFEVIPEALDVLRRELGLLNDAREMASGAHFDTGTS